MKTIFKTALVACVALVAGLAGCSKEQSARENNETGEKTVRIHIEQGTGTRAAGEAVGAQVVTMKDAVIYFAGAGNNIVASVEVVFTAEGKALAYNEEAKTVGIDVLTGVAAGSSNGAEIVNLPASVANVYVVGNYKAGGIGAAYPTTGNISQFNGAGVISLASQSAANGVANVALFGKSGLGAVVTPATPTSNAKYSVSINVAPVAARFEVGQIAATFDANDSADGVIVSHIASFSLDGIYLSNVYRSMGFDGTAAGTLVPNSVAIADYSSANAAYAADGIISDYTAANLVAQDAKTYAPVANAASAEGDPVWAYNLLAPAGAPMSTLVVRVSDVVLDNGDDELYSGDKTLTVRNIYKEVAGVKTKIGTLTPGEVYSITNLEFAEDHLTNNPNQNLIDVTVKITMMSWVPVTVSYDFD